MGSFEALSNCNIKLFQLFCIVLVAYLTYEQFLQYLKNEDSSSVSFRKFNQEKRDLYPSFSICMHSKKGGILQGSSKPSGLKTDLEMEMYHKMLIGKEKLDQRFEDIDFDHNAVEILDEFVEMFVSYTKQGKDLNPWHRYKKSNPETPPFYKSYQDPYFRCISKPIKFTKHQILHYDYLVMNSLDFYNYISNVSHFDNSTNLFLYVHQTGQLVREFGKQSFQLNLMDFLNAMKDTNNYREIHISHVEVVRKRSDGVTPCNDELEDEDRLWIESVVSSAKCIPTYWKRFNLTSPDDGPNLPVCNSSTQYDILHTHYLPPNNFDYVTRLYKEPCSQMKITLNLLQKDLPSPDNSLVLAFNYNTEEYRETVSHRSFGRPHDYAYYKNFLLVRVHG